MLRTEPVLSPLTWHVLLTETVDDDNTEGVNYPTNPGEEEEHDQVQDKVHATACDAGNGARGNYEPVVVD